MKEYENTQGILNMLNELKEKLNAEYEDDTELIYQTAGDIASLCYALKSKGIVIDSGFMVSAPSNVEFK